MKAIKKWRAGIEVNGLVFNLGDFAKEPAADLAHNEAARKHFGAIAYQNEIGRSLKKRSSSKKK